MCILHLYSEVVIVLYKYQHWIESLSTIVVVLSVLLWLFVCPDPALFVLAALEGHKWV